MENLKSPDQVAELLHMSVQFVKDHAEEMGVVHMGGGKHRAGRLRFPLSAVEAYVRQHAAVSKRRVSNEKPSRQKPKRMAG